ncbi:flavin-nucleotide-binding protein [Gymnopilus junonius]|uniref:Flavin-nucleotide-binding protein n=1 Tax=Gymnopilus junonius TaxID=109634 RepID=A0A9P5NCM3_GYMJU|nr:flavin-nucleotide-binding protein [Gymnopilus junonius]
MPSEAEVYAHTPRSSVNRLKQRATYDHEKIHSIIDSAPVLHVSFNPTSFEDDPFPTILPMLGCTGSFTSSGAQEKSAVVIYLHGHSASRFMKIPSQPPSYLEEVTLPGIPVCVAATHIDGLVLAYTPFNHSCNYRSAVVHGYASAVEEPEEKTYALQLITDNMLSERWDNSRVPPTEAEMKSTGVIRVDIVSASAKIRAYGVGNGQPDLDNEQMRKGVWTGYGEPVSAEENLVGTVPTYIGDWIKGHNDEAEKYSKQITSLKAPKKS